MHIIAPVAHQPERLPSPHAVSHSCRSSILSVCRDMRAAILSGLEVNSCWNQSRLGRNAYKLISSRPLGDRSHRETHCLAADRSHARPHALVSIGDDSVIPADIGVSRAEPKAASVRGLWSADPNQIPVRCQ